MGYSKGKLSGGGLSRRGKFSLMAKGGGKNFAPPVANEGALNIPILT